jgi:hypothetical protein
MIRLLGGSRGGGVNPAAEVIGAYAPHIKSLEIMALTAEEKIPGRGLE